MAKNTTILYKWSSIYKILKLENETEIATKFITILKWQRKKNKKHLFFFLDNLFKNKQYLKKFYTGEIF